jgi:hypothetical protein
MNNDLEFFTTEMPETRPADYYLGCLGGSVFMDFDKVPENRISLRRISFDGFGCCDLGHMAVPMSEVDSGIFKEAIKAGPLDSVLLTLLIKKTIVNNRKFIWEDALGEYDLL